MNYKTGTCIKAKTVGKGVRKGEIIKVLENTFIISSGVHNYLVKKDEENIEIVKR